ncbi:RNA polymerase subunit sigma-24 [Streptomyces sp. NBC_01476]|uniref:sigma factor-like helix-turn-helix DNA-binding protein n=1 Tax=Streptomyces sp. NBC_01476 TaxID=2903881 RepID=UPI002E3798CF|nr:sigma factor-like helix-turn-helix DNA-binding protein [Streptomyces sp. NBC_01476]
MDSLTHDLCDPDVAGAPALRLPGAVAGAEAIRLFGAVYRMLGSACGAWETVRGALTVTVQPDVSDLVREVVGAALRRADPARQRRDGHTWLPEPVLTGRGALGPMDTAERRESVSMARLVVLERLPPAERAAYVLREVFGYGAADAAAVLGVPEARYRALRRRARHRVQEADWGAAPRTPDGEAQRWASVGELLHAIREEDTAALEEALADDVVAWSDGAGRPDVIRRPVLGAVKVARFLLAAGGRIPDDAQGHIAEVNGDPALLAVAGGEVVGVLAPEFGAQGMVGIRAVADPARLSFVSRQWAADRPGHRD